MRKFANRRGLFMALAFAIICIVTTAWVLERRRLHAIEGQVARMCRQLGYELDKDLREYRELTARDDDGDDAASLFQLRSSYMRARSLRAHVAGTCMDDVDFECIPKVIEPGTLGELERVANAFLQGHSCRR